MNVQDLSYGLIQVIEERNKQKEKGYNENHDINFNKFNQLPHVVSILIIPDGNMNDSMIQTFSLQGTEVEGWDNQLILTYLKLDYKDRIKIAAALLVAELEKLQRIEDISKL